MGVLAMMMIAIRELLVGRNRRAETGGDSDVCRMCHAVCSRCLFPQSILLEPVGE